MAPVRGKSASVKGSTRGANKRKAMTNSKPTSRPSSSSTSSSKSKSKPPSSSSKPRPSISKKGVIPRKKKRVYTEKELNIPSLNMITPTGVQKPQGKKKGKVFVDDQESMMTILAMVNADKEGQIESKMMKARQMEEIRQARAAEMEERQRERGRKFDETKDSLRRGRNKKTDASAVDTEAAAANASKPLKLAKSTKKRVSFG